MRKDCRVKKRWDVEICFTCLAGVRESDVGEEEKLLIHLVDSFGR